VEIINPEFLARRPVIRGRHFLNNLHCWLAVSERLKPLRHFLIDRVIPMLDKPDFWPHDGLAYIANRISIGVAQDIN